MNSRRNDARIAGLWYLSLAMTGAFGIMYIPTAIVVAGDPAATAQNIVSSGWVFRLSIVSNLASQAIFVCLALALNRLLREVDPTQAKLMVAFVTVAVPVGFLNTLNPLAAQLFVSGSDYLSVFEQDKLDAMALAALGLFDRGVLIAQVFWGLWLLPFGILVIKSKFIPKLFGILLVINCFAYLIVTLARLLEYGHADVLTYVLMPLLALGEFAVILWLLIIGATDPVDRSTPAAR